MPFSHFGLHSDLLRAFGSSASHAPTPSSRTIPVAMHGRDVRACAMTGSGKTAAFVPAILHRITANSRGTTRALVLNAHAGAGGG